MVPGKVLQIEGEAGGGKGGGTHVADDHRCQIVDPSGKGASAHGGLADARGRVKLEGQISRAGVELETKSRVSPTGENGREVAIEAGSPSR